MKNLFISYSRKDNETARRVAELLKSTGYDLWIDTKHIPGGGRWRKEVAQAIKRAEVFILILSSHSAGSSEVERELELAGDANLPILPVILERDIQIPEGMKYLLAGVHWITLDDDFEKGTSQLLKALSEMDRVGPRNYVWGVNAEDLKSMPDFLGRKDLSAQDRLLSLLSQLPELQGRAHGRLMAEMESLTLKDRQLTEEIQGTRDRLDKLLEELPQLQETTLPETYGLIKEKIGELTQKECLLCEESHRIHDQTMSVFGELKKLRESRKPIDDVWEKIR